MSNPSEGSKPRWRARAEAAPGGQFKRVRTSRHPIGRMISAAESERVEWEAGLVQRRSFVGAPIVCSRANPSSAAIHGEEYGYERHGTVLVERPADDTLIDAVTTEHAADHIRLDDSGRPALLLQLLLLLSILDRLDRLNLG